MADTEYTPGPWTAFKPEGDRRLIAGKIVNETQEWQILDSSQTTMARVWQCDRSRRVDDEANARLIAAAPEILAALEAMLYCFCSCISDGNGELEDDAPAIMKARAALAKATGRRIEDIYTGKKICDRAAQQEAA